MTDQQRMIDELRRDAEASAAEPNEWGWKITPKGKRVMVSLVLSFGTLMAGLGGIIGWILRGIFK